MMILTIVLVASFLFLILASFGLVKLKDDEDKAVTKGSFARASRWMLLFYTPGFVLYILKTFTSVLKVPGLLIPLLIAAGFILGFFVFYVTEKQLRDKRRSQMEKSE
ncbi:hypothetical protein PT279_00655 [Bifidobacterium sp. ESL0784]|uniref:hypothetical protein n=1 Tax=Bifidobacterium sp. ESL0784 TaxID=2983231 RepID=UPI0023F8FC82|nr:hypothetical protein [Bifidobacterium sp. ESL0784]MDF7640115.1 hypothetical protein [Bifidobacterium sp. ESL0784]